MPTRAPARRDPQRRPGVAHDRGAREAGGGQCLARERDRAATATLVPDLDRAPSIGSRATRGAFTRQRLRERTADLDRDHLERGGGIREPEATLVRFVETRRETRERLRGQWGIVDTQDCISAARYLADVAAFEAGR